MTPPALPDQFQPFSPPEFTAADKPKFRWHKFLGCLRKFWWLPLATVALTTLVAAIYVWRMTPLYTSEAKMWETVKLRLPEGGAFSDDANNPLGTQAELMRGNKIRGAVLDRLAAGGYKVPLDDTGKPLGVDMNLFQSPKSAIIVLQATASDPAYARAYLDAAMDAYFELKKEARKVVTGSALASITTQVQKTDRELKEEMDILENFKRTNNLTILQAEGASAGQYLISLKTQLSDLQLQDRLLAATLRDIATNSGVGRTTLPSGLDAAAPVASGYSTAYQSLQTLKLERDKLARVFKPKHPKMVKLDEEIDRANRLLEVYVRESHSQLLAEQKVLQIKMANMTASINEWENRANQANALIIQADQLRLNVQRLQQVYDRLTALVQSVDMSRNIDQETLAILEPASEASLSPAKKKKALQMGVVAGLALGAGLIMLLTLRDDRFSNVVEFNERLGDTVIGQIPDVEVLPGKTPLLLDEGESQYMLAESYRNLRSALLFMAVDGSRPKVVLITSALPGEGKSTIAANLAQALALCGSRVVLVDADLRRGVVHERMGLQSEPGLTELLRGSAVLEQVIQVTSVANLSFIARGKSSGESADMFLGVKFAQVMAWLREQFDYVLIDTSPVLATDDAPTLAPMVDGTLMVVRGNFTGGKQVNAALDQLYQRQAKILGVVFNRANASTRSYQYYKYKEYSQASAD